MKKIIFALAFVLLAIQSFSQTVYYPGTRVFTGTLNVSTNAIFQVGTFYLNKNADSIWLEKPYGTWVAPLSETLPIIYRTETASRTIYYTTHSAGGSDTTGDGTAAHPFNSPLRCVQDIAPYVVGATITISGSGNADFPQTADLYNEVASKTFINSKLAFVGTTITDVETGFTVSKTASRLFAYTLSKAGLTAAADQYVGNFVTTTAKTAFYPVAYNAAGTDNFEIEYVNTNYTTATNIAAFGVTWTNPNNLLYAFDLTFKSSDGSRITFANMNFNGGTTVSITLQATTLREFNACSIQCHSLTIGESAGSGNVTNIKFNQCAIIESVAGSGALVFLQAKANTFFVRCFLYSAYANSQGCINLTNNNTTRINNGIYLRGNGVGSAINANQGATSIYIMSGVESRNFANFMGVGSNFIISWINPTTDATCYVEFISITNLLSRLPYQGTKLLFTNIYGSLPTNLVKSVSTGYVFVDPKNDIHISLPGIYGEYESEVSANLADNSTGTISVGDITQNKAVWIDYQILRSTSVEQGTVMMTNKSGTDIVDNDEFDDTGVTFSKSLVGNVITLGWATSSTGAAATFKYTIRRIMM